MVIGKIILIRYFFYRSVSYSLNFFMIIFNAAHFLQILLVSVKKVRLSLSFLCRIQVVQAWNRLTASIFQSPTCNSNRFDRINNCAHCAVIYIYIYMCSRQYASWAVAISSQIVPYITHARGAHCLSVYCQCGVFIKITFYY